jgi:hypothetical protein
MTMPTWADVLVLSVAYLGVFGGLWQLYRKSLPRKNARPSQLLPGLDESNLTTDTNYWGLY